MQLSVLTLYSFSYDLTLPYYTKASFTLGPSAYSSLVDYEKKQGRASTKICQ